MGENKVTLVVDPPRRSIKLAYCAFIILDFHILAGLNATVLYLTIQVNKDIKKNFFL